ncbi:MAG: ABC transporter permease [Rhodospirillaceae bacterium]
MFRQLTALTYMNLLAARTRLGGSLVIVLGMAAVVGVTVSVLSLSLGLIHSFDTYARADRAIVRSQSSADENTSRLPREAAVAIADTPGIKKGSGGRPLAAAEAQFGIPVVYKASKLETGLPIRGTTARLLEFRPDFRMVEGRMFTPGLREVIVGREVAELAEGMAIGGEVKLPNSSWTIVGVYESNGFADWLMLTDAVTLLDALPPNNFSSVTVALESADDFEAFKAALESNPVLDVVAERETDYWIRFHGPQLQFYDLIAYGLGAIMAVGALFAALNIMYAAINARTREIATLRAVGFSPAAVMTAILAETVVLAALGAGIGIAIAWFAFNGRAYQAAHFTLVVDGSLALIGASVAVGIGLLAGLFPAIRAARIPVATALQVR